MAQKVLQALGEYRTSELKKLDMQFPRLVYGGEPNNIASNFEMFYRAILLCEYYAEFFISQ